MSDNLGGDRRDPRLGLSEELVPAHAQAAVEALDQRGVIIVPGESPAAALTAAVLLVLLARTHAHVMLANDAPLPRNPWGATSLADLLTRLERVRPAATAGASQTMTVSTGTVPGADRYVAPARWTVLVSSHLDTHLVRLAEVTDNESTGAPYGGMFAAAVVAADLFSTAVGPLGLPVPARRAEFLWNLLDFKYTAALEEPTGMVTWPELLFAGCGSVGSSAVAALACDDLNGLHATTVDSDDFDPERNTYRYPAATMTAAAPKADWTAGLLREAGAVATPLAENLRDWTTAQPAPGLDGIVIASVDSVDGRYEVADVLARTTLSAAIRGLAFHVQREHLGDGFRCPFCDFVSTASPLAQAAADAALTGLPEERIIQFAYQSARLEQRDVDQMVAVGRLTADGAVGLVGARLADLRNRFYAQAAVPSPTPDSVPPAPLSAPFVSWAVGVLLAAECAKAARGLDLVDRRLELDMHGYPGDFTVKIRADSSGRCACARPTRVRWMKELYRENRNGARRASDSSSSVVRDIHMEMQAVTSDNVRAVGYETATRTMRVQFHNGLIYEYCDVNLPLFEQMLLPHAWGRMGRVVRAHRYRRVAA